MSRWTGSVLSHLTSVVACEPMEFIIIPVSSLCSSGTWLPEATSFDLQATRKIYRVAWQSDILWNSFKKSVYSICSWLVSIELWVDKNTKKTCTHMVGFNLICIYYAVPENIDPPPNKVLIQDINNIFIV